MTKTFDSIGFTESSADPFQPETGLICSLAEALARWYPDTWTTVLNAKLGEWVSAGERAVPSSFADYPMEALILDGERDNRIAAIYYNGDRERDFGLDELLQFATEHGICLFHLPALPAYSPIYLAMVFLEKIPPMVELARTQLVCPSCKGPLLFKERKAPGELEFLPEFVCANLHTRKRRARKGCEQTVWSMHWLVQCAAAISHMVAPVREQFFKKLAKDAANGSLYADRNVLRRKLTAQSGRDSQDVH